MAEIPDGGEPGSSHRSMKMGYRTPLFIREYGARPRELARSRNDYLLRRHLASQGKRRTAHQDGPRIHSPGQRHGRPEDAVLAAEYVDGLMQNLAVVHPQDEGPVRFELGGPHGTDSSVSAVLVEQPADLVGLVLGQVACVDERLDEIFGIPRRCTGGLGDNACEEC